MMRRVAGDSVRTRHSDHRGLDATFVNVSPMKSIDQHSPRRVGRDWCPLSAVTPRVASAHVTDKMRSSVPRRTDDTANSTEAPNPSAFKNARDAEVHFSV